MTIFTRRRTSAPWLRCWRTRLCRWSSCPVGSFSSRLPASLPSATPSPGVWPTARTRPTRMSGNGPMAMASLTSSAGGLAWTSCTPTSTWARTSTSSPSCSSAAGPAVCPSSTAGPTAPATTTAAAVRSTPASSKTLQAAATTLAATTTTTTEPTTTTPRSTLPTTTTTEYQPSLFCFLMLMPTGYEPELVRAQVAKRAGVFSCDQHAAFSTAVIDLGGGVVTTKIGAESKKGSWGSWLNTDNFLQAWDKILAEGRFRKSDWAVKADPDCVFFPDRLKLHLQMLFPGGADDGFYIKNCPKSFGFMGSLEIISTNGVDAYAKHKDYCRKNMNAAGSGEDGFMQACLKYSGVVGKEDFSLLVDHYCGFGKCEGNTKNVAFHPFKDTNGWFQCWSQVTAAR
mmetsp:Transcript_36211/g.100533  ORF Transcript_36211/g.100533 Transcript_36211/m.100533 type:complete len:398 (-) Transcript_36211:116-1309(-)